MSTAAANVAPIESNGPRKRPFSCGKQPRFKKAKIKSKTAQEGSTEEVLLADIRDLLARQELNDPASETNGAQQGSITVQGPPSLPEPFTELDLTVSELSSTGDGLARSSDSNHVYVVPFTVPGDVVTAKIIKHFPQQSYSLTDFVKVVKASSKRDDTLIRCPYFANCSGCQFQMLPYEDQLAHKKSVVEKAFRNFSGIPAVEIPAVYDTVGSPLQYGYRTKLTPHFDGPQGGRKANRKGEKPKWDAVPPIGFMKKGQRRTIDIEDCPIGTDAVRLGLQAERKRVAAEIETYKRGATLLLRESTRRIPRNIAEGHISQDLTDHSSSETAVNGDFVYEKTCIKDSNATTTEYVDDFAFTNPAGAFFQNNNCILPAFTEYVRSVFRAPVKTTTKLAAYASLSPSMNASPPTSDFRPDSRNATPNLIDAYSGSGLFSITLSSLFEHTLGIDISPSSITSATHNARLNKLSSSQTSFVAADASHLFSPKVIPAHFTPETTAVVLDPPRKGCDDGFLRQLLHFGPERIVYVSCNVHTQARDVGILWRGIESNEADSEFKEDEPTSEGSSKEAVQRTRYVIESLRGFDFFPQTGHVEGVAVLRRRRRSDGVV